MLTLVLAAASASAQTVGWENRGQAEFSGAVEAVDIGHGIVVAPSAVGDALGNSQWMVRGLDARTGATVWEDRFGPVFFGLAKDVAVQDERAFVAGWTYTVRVGFDFVVRAYDVRTGAVRWSQSVSLGPGCVAQSNRVARCVAKAVAVGGGRVFVVGHLSRTAARSDFAVLAFDAETGAPLWESVTDPLGAGSDDYAWAVAVEGGRVFALGEIGNGAGMQLQAHDVRTGAILWRRQLPGARNFTLKETLAVDRRHVYIAGRDAALRFFVQACDPKTGAVEWEDHIDGSLGQVSALVLADAGEDGHDRHDRGESGSLFAVGVAGCDPATGLGCQLAVRAYDARRGLVWSRLDAAAGGDWFALSAAAGRGRVFASALELLDDGVYHPVIRSYAAASGASSSSIRFDDGPGSAPFGDAGYVYGMLVARGGLVAAGHLYRVDGEPDAVVRQYRLHDRRRDPAHDDDDDDDGDR